MKRVLMVIAVSMISSGAFAQQCFYSNSAQPCGCVQQSCSMPLQSCNVNSGVVYNQNASMPVNVASFQTGTAYPGTNPVFESQPFPTNNVSVSSIPTSGTPNMTYTSNGFPASTSMAGNIQTVGYSMPVIANTMPVSTVAYTTSPAPYSQPAYPSQVYAQPIASNIPVQPSQNMTYPVSQNSVYTSTYPSNNSFGSTGGVAQQKAESAARMNLRGHVGGGLGGAQYEGVGWSNLSPNDAIQRCCYWGTRPVSQIGVSRGSDGMWYACVLYQ